MPVENLAARRNFKASVNPRALKRLGELNPDQTPARAAQQVVLEAVFPGDVSKYMTDVTRKAGTGLTDPKIAKDIRVTLSLKKEAMKVLAWPGESISTLAGRLLLETLSNPPIGRVRADALTERVQFWMEKEDAADLLSRFPQFSKIGELAKEVFLYKIKKALRSNIPWLVLFPASDENIRLENAWVMGSQKHVNSDPIFFVVPEALVAWIYDRFGDRIEMSFPLFARRVVLNEVLFPTIPQDAIEPKEKGDVRLSVYLTVSQWKQILADLANFGKNLPEITRNILQLRIKEFHDQFLTDRRYVY